jgi:hypothetical protein
MGVFPVPPKDKLPTLIIGTAYFFDFKIFASYKPFLSHIIKPYKHDIG